MQNQDFSGKLFFFDLFDPILTLFWPVPREWAPNAQRWVQNVKTPKRWPPGDAEYILSDLEEVDFWPILTQLCGGLEEEGLMSHVMGSIMSHVRGGYNVPR